MSLCLSHSSSFARSSHLLASRQSHNIMKSLTASTRETHGTRSSVALRLLQLACISASWCMLLATVVTPVDQMAVSIIQTKHNISQDVFVSKQTGNTSVAYILPPGQTQQLNDYTIRVGLWQICANNKLKPAWVCTDQYYRLTDEQKNNAPSLADFLTDRVLASAANGLDGLGATMTTVPLALAWTGIFGILYYSLAFFSFLRPRIWQPHSQRDTCLTNPAVQLVNSFLVVLVTVIAWTFALVIQLASWDTLDKMAQIRVESVNEGSVIILLSVSAILQVAAFLLQYGIYRSIKRKELVSDENYEPDKPTFDTVEKATVNHDDVKKDPSARPASYEFSELPKYLYRSSIFINEKLAAAEKIKRDSKLPERPESRRLSSTEV